MGKVFLAVAFALAATAQSAQKKADMGYTVNLISDGLYWVTDGMYNTAFLVYDRGVVAIDAPPTLGKKYLEAIRSVTQQPVTHLIYSHSHADHIAAAHLFPKGVEIIAQEETAATLRMRDDPRRPVPTRTFRDQLTLKVGSSVLELAYKGRIHEPGNIFIYAPAQKTLVLIDIVYPGWVPYKNLGIAADVQAYIGAHKLALAYPFETLVAGHVDRLGKRSDVEESAAFVSDLRRSVEESFSEVSFPSVAATVKEPNQFKVWNAYQDAVTASCTRKMMPSWGGRLKAIDTYLSDNCWAMVESVGVDLAPAGDGRSRP